MRLLTPFVILLIFANNTIAQTETKPNPVRIHIYDGPLNLNESKSPLVVVDNYTTKMTRFFINTNNIESINVIKDSSAINKYGEDGRNGVVFIKVKNNCKLLNLEALLNQYNIAEENKQLRICINKTLIKEPSLLVFDTQKIKQVEITTDFKWVTTDEIKNGEKFINIVLAEN